MPNLITKAWDYLWGKPVATAALIPEGSTRNLGKTISKQQLERIRQSIATWREAIIEAENAWTPYRVKMQRLFIDTRLNGHVYACMERRKDLTLLRDFIIVNEKDEEIEEWTKFFKDKNWFSLWLNYGLDALFYGYQLVALGDVVNDEFPNLAIIPRQNISPDRLNVTHFPYSLSGWPFLEEPYKDFHTYFITPTDNAASKCGYGLLYSVAYYEIIIRNLTGANVSYVEVFGQPYRVGKTEKTEEDERQELANTLDAMGVNGWALMDTQDSIEFVESSNSGTGHLSYDNLESRMLKIISKIILGHADAIDSTPGKLGAGQDDQSSPVNKALSAKKTKDGAYIETNFNTQLIVQLRNIGFDIPMGAKGKFKNDEEEEEMRKKEDESNQEAAALMKTISDAGGQPDWKYFNKRTGLNVEEKEVEETPEQKIESSISMNEKVKNLFK